MCVFLKDPNFCLLVVKDDDSLPCSQNAFLYLIMSQMNPVHIFITPSLYDSLSGYLFLLLCCNILNSHLKFENLERCLASAMHWYVK